jgi:hypothetical protein
MSAGDVLWFRYVRHAERADYEARGWVFAADLGLPHGAYSVLMQWAGEGVPR